MTNSIQKISNKPYTNTYPKIEVDHDINFPNSVYNIKHVTVEEWNDLLHHTHKQANILDDDGNFMGTGAAPGTGGTGEAAKKSDLDSLALRVKSLEESQAAVTKSAFDSLAQRVSEIENGGFITQSDLGEYVKREELPAEQDLSNYATKDDLSEYTKTEDLPEIPDLTDYAKKTDIPEPQDLSGYAQKTDLEEYLKTEELNLSDYAQKVDLDQYLKAQDLDLSGYATKSELDDYIKDEELDLSDYAQKTDLDQYIKAQDLDLSDYVKKQDLPQEQDMSEYVKKTDVVVTQEVYDDIIRRITALEEAAKDDSEFIIDYDLEQPGVQDIEGNTVHATYTATNVTDFRSKLSDAADGDTIKLGSNVDASSESLAVSGKEVVLDLNSNTINAGTSSTNGIRVGTGGKLTIKNGNITTDQAYDANHTSPVITTDGGEIVIDNIAVNTILQDPANQGQFAVGVYGNGKLTINSGNIQAGWYAVSGNGSRTTADAEIIINGGNLVSKADFAIYNPGRNTLTINDGFISGGAGAVSANAGNIVINGGTLTSTGDGDTGEWADGTSGQLPAVINLNGKYAPVTCTINGGKFITDGSVPIIISGTKYPVSVSIVAGEFSVKPETDWIAAGSVCSDEKNQDGLYVVSKTA